MMWHIWSTLVRYTVRKVRNTLIQQHVPAVEAFIGTLSLPLSSKEVGGHPAAFLRLFFTNQIYLHSLSTAVTGRRRLCLKHFVFHYHVQMLQSTDGKLYMAGQ